VSNEKIFIENRGMLSHDPDIGVLKSNLFGAGLAIPRTGTLPSKQIEKQFLLNKLDMNLYVAQLYAE
jgi:hypothetical protein